ncbi:hypothetical protein [Pontimicrobium sp. MEBiC06410]
MKTARIYNYRIAIVFVWVGFVCAISFMEAWLKFQAPGITTKLGLGIGQLVFGMLNKVELTSAALIVLSLILYKPKKLLKESYYLFIGLALLIVESVWLLPALDARATLIIKGEILTESMLHLYYVLFEIIKTVCLVMYGMKLLKRMQLNK